MFLIVKIKDGSDVVDYYWCDFLGVSVVLGRFYMDFLLLVEFVVGYSYRNFVV